MQCQWKADVRQLLKQTLANPLLTLCTKMVLLICENEFQHIGAIKWIFLIKSLCLNKYLFTDTHDIDSLLFMQNFMKVPFKMLEFFPHSLGGGLEIWASIHKLMLRLSSLLIWFRITLMKGQAHRKHSLHEQSRFYWSCSSVVMNDATAQTPLAQSGTPFSLCLQNMVV